MFLQRFEWLSRKQRAPAGLPAGLRAYVIGDIHAQCELLLDLMRLVEEDNVGRDSANLQLIFLGDYVDRGLQSAQLLQILVQASQFGNAVFLRGNHEQLLLDVHAGSIESAMIWPKIGGAATLSSFGVDLSSLDLSDPIDVIEATQRVIPAPIIDWLSSLPFCYRLGDYYFVHAGVRPGIPLESQSERDQLWIRDEFTKSARVHGATIVHGHTVTPQGPAIADNRIGLDTGAYKTGRLTALGLQGHERWYIEVFKTDRISSHQRGQAHGPVL